MAHLIANTDDLLLAAVAAGGVLLTAMVPDDKSLRISDLDKIMRVLLRCDPLIRVSIVKRTEVTVTHAKHCLHVS